MERLGLANNLGCTQSQNEAEIFSLPDASTLHLDAEVSVDAIKRRPRNSNLEIAEEINRKARLGELTVASDVETQGIN